MVVITLRIICFITAEDLGEAVEDEAAVRVSSVTIPPLEQIPTNVSRLYMLRLYCALYDTWEENK